MRLETEKSGKRPKRAIIDLHREGGLEYLYYLAQNRSQREYDCVNAVEIYHIHKQGNNVRMLAAERIAPNRYMLEKYERVRKNRMNPLFKRFYLQSILQGVPWHQGSLDILAAYPTELLVYVRSKTPTNMPYFSRDAGKKFNDLEHKLQIPEDDMNTEENQDNLLALRIRGLVRQYVQRKAESKSGMTFKEFKKDEKGKTIYPTTYREAVEKVCMDAFLALRGRREQDFVEYFTGTLCSVPQYLPEDDFLLVSQALINERDKVKALSMLAVSACSYLPVNKENTKDNQGEKS
ncbi:MAG: type I-MYXAN CRISPR-associated protein Cmx8 [Candidatus Electrothrix sp. AX5]|nr:type I-MYXAN CRISPR-associated protein Cmx8 [Candidatus Electrothrix sp. AX5]